MENIYSRLMPECVFPMSATAPDIRHYHCRELDSGMKRLAMTFVTGSP